jgi:hypothetical protein
MTVELARISMRSTSRRLSSEHRGHGANSSGASPDEHREDHGVGDEQRRHRDGRDVVGRAQADADVEPEALGERGDQVDGPDDVEEPDEGSGRLASRGARYQRAMSP